MQNNPQAYEYISGDMVVSPAKYKKATTLLINNEQMSFLSPLNKGERSVKFWCNKKNSIAILKLNNISKNQVDWSINCLDIKR